MNTHYYIQPSCGSIPESLRHWFTPDLAAVCNIARGVVIGLHGAGRKSAYAQVFEIPDDAPGIDERAKLRDCIEL